MLLKTPKLPIDLKETILSYFSKIRSHDFDFHIKSLEVPCSLFCKYKSEKFIVSDNNLFNLLMVVQCDHHFRDLMKIIKSTEYSPSALKDANSFLKLPLDFLSLSTSRAASFLITQRMESQLEWETVIKDLNFLHDRLKYVTIFKDAYPSYSNISSALYIETNPLEIINLKLQLDGANISNYIIRVINCKKSVPSNVILVDKAGNESTSTVHSTDLSEEYAIIKLQDTYTPESL